MEYHKPFAYLMKITMLRYLWLLISGGIVLICLSACSKSPKQEVTQDNIGPVVDAGDNITVEEQKPIVLSGSATDADGSIRAYRWTQVSGKAAAITTGQNQPSAIFVAPTLTQTETLVFQLRVKDDKDASATDVVAVTVNPVNAAPQVNTSIKAQANEQTRVNLLASAVDSDGSIKKIEWQQTQGANVDIIDADTLNAYFTAPIVIQIEELSFKLLVTDSEDAVIEKDISVQIMPVNKKPLVGDFMNLEVMEESLVTLKADASDEDGSIVDYQWQQLSGSAVKLENTNQAQVRFFAPAVIQEENISLQLTVTDNEQATQSKTVSVRVSPLPLLAITGVVNGGPPSIGAQLTIKRLRSNATDGRKEAVITDTTPLGKFASQIPGSGLYKISTQGIYIDSWLGTTLDKKVEVNGIYLVDKANTDININLLTHIAHKRIIYLIKVKNVAAPAAIAQAETELLEALKVLHAAPSNTGFTDMGLYNTSFSSSSAYLLLLSTLLYDYASTQATTGKAAERINNILDSFSEDLATDGKLNYSTAVLATMKSLIPTINSQFVDRSMAQTAMQDPEFSTTSINTILDTDLDGATNDTDGDADGDGVNNEDDYTPYGLSFDQPQCRFGRRVGNLGNGGTFHIQSFWKSDQYINTVDGLKSSPIHSNDLIAGIWRLNKIEGADDIYTIQITSNDQYLSLTTHENKKSLVLKNSPELSKASHHWKLIKYEGVPAIYARFYIVNVADPEYALTNQEQTNDDPGALSYIVGTSKYHPGWFSAQWHFCAATETQPLKSDNSYNLLDLNPPETCRISLNNTITESDNGIYQIQNLWRPEQFINRFKGLHSSPLSSKNWNSGQWRLEQADDKKHFFIISNMKDNAYLLFEKGTNSLRVGPQNAASELQQMWLIEHQKRNIYHIRSAYKPNFYLSTQSQSETLATSSYVVSLRNDNQGGWLSSLWIFCKNESPKIF